MLEKILLLLLESKTHFLVALKGPALASLFVIGSTGFVVTGTIDGQKVDLVVKPIEAKTCIDALIAQTEALLEVDALARDAQAQLRHLRARAREQADDQHKLLDEAALRAKFESSSQAIRDGLSDVRRQILAALDLGPCQDGDPGTGMTVDLAELRAKYDKLVSDFGKKLKGVLDEAQNGFDLLVRNAPERPRASRDTSGSNSSDSNSID